MGIFFDSPKPRVTQEEWKKVRGILYTVHNFTTKELDTIEGIFRGDMSEEKYKDMGVDTDELIRGIQYMRQNINVHRISADKINKLEMEMMKKISTY